MKTLPSQIRMMLMALLLAALVMPGQPARAYGVLTGLKAPFPGGLTYMVTGTHDRAAGRHALDIGMISEKVLAMKAGRIVFAGWDAGGGGHMLKIEHADGTYALYLHLSSFTRSSGWVNQGDAIAVSGNSGNNIYHLHVAVLSKEGVELPMIFDEAGGRELNYRDTLTSSQGSVPIVFEHGASTLWQDQAWGRANLKICADNLAGQMVYVRFFQRGKSLDYGKRAYSTCVTFWDMDGAGTLSPSTTWYTQAALNQKPNPYWSFPCAWPSGGQGLCDSLRRP